jgi:ribose/xylose/arabinose/galactoside ABC-type transport system permease subunit
LTVQRRATTVVLVVLLVVDLLSGVNVTGLTTQAAILAIIALGMTFVVVTGGIDLSVGSVYGASAVLAAYASRWGVVAAVVVPLAAGALFGAAQGWLISRKLPAFVVTLCGALFVRELLRFVTTEGHETYLVPTTSGLLWLGQLTVLVTVVLYVAGGLLLQRTPFGLRLFAVGGSEDASTLMGVPVTRTKITVYVLSAVLAGLAGVLSAGHLGMAVTSSGLWLEVEVVLVVVIGGTALTGGVGSVSGTLLGVGVLWASRGLINVSMSMQTALSGVLLVVVVIVQAVARKPRRTG